MGGRFFLRRRFFVNASLLCILASLGLAARALLLSSQHWAHRTVGVAYNLGVGIALYYFTIQTTTVDSLLYAMAISFGNALLLVLGVMYSCLLEYNHEKPLACFYKNALPAVFALVFLHYSAFVSVVRRYIVFGLVRPTKVQRETGVETAVVLVRREYPEAFK